MDYMMEPSRRVPIAWEGDLCVLGGGCTGVFAALRAARLGLRVAIVERQNCFGGTATSGLVNIWHSMMDFDFRERVVAGLSQEVIDTLVQEGNARTLRSANRANSFNPMALIRLLDEMVCREKIRVFLHTQYAGAEAEGGLVKAVYIQNKDGRSALRARFFVDATGDGDLLRDLGCERYFREGLQPPSSCFLLRGGTSGELIEWLITRHGAEFGLEDDWGWFGEVPGLPGISFRADNHVFGRNLSRADDLTLAEIEGRRRMFALEALLKKYASADYAIVNACASIGIRETAHYTTRYMANEKDLLQGARFDDAILQGTYRVDIHHHEDNGITFKELDGRMDTHYGKGEKVVHGNWRRELGLDDHYARYYQVPFSVMVQKKYGNLLPAGRMIHADEGAFGALRVMINLNQMGEAAGVAAYLCLQSDCDVRQLDGRSVRDALRRGGSAL